MRALFALCVLAAMPVGAEILTAPRVLACEGAVEGASTLPWFNCPSGAGFVAPIASAKVATGSYSSGSWHSFGALAGTITVNACPVGANLISPTSCRKADNSGWANLFMRKDVLTAVVVPAPPPPPAVTGNMTLSWMAVTKNTNGSPATITGYRVEYGQGNFDQYITTTLTRHTLTLTPGDWQARVVALASGAESVPSASVSKKVVADVPLPVGCLVSDWSAWVGDWGPCEGGNQTRTQTRSRTITTQPANGGAACPSLTESLTESRVCVAPSAPTHHCTFSDCDETGCNVVSCTRQ